MFSASACLPANRQLHFAGTTIVALLFLLNPRSIPSILMGACVGYLVCPALIGLAHGFIEFAIVIGVFLAMHKLSTGKVSGTARLGRRRRWRWQRSGLVWSGVAGPRESARVSLPRSHSLAVCGGVACVCVSCPDRRGRGDPARRLLLRMVTITESVTALRASRRRCGCRRCSRHPLAACLTSSSLCIDRPPMRPFLSVLPGSAISSTSTTRPRRSSTRPIRSWATSTCGCASQPATSHSNRCCMYLAANQRRAYA